MRGKSTGLKGSDGLALKVGDHVRLPGLAIHGYVLGHGDEPDMVKIRNQIGHVQDVGVEMVEHNPKRKPSRRSGKRWIQSALRYHKKGALHRQLHVPVGEKIPLSTLRKASHKPGKVGRRARLAINLRSITKRAKGRR